MNSIEKRLMRACVATQVAVLDHGQEITKTEMKRSKRDTIICAEEVLRLAKLLRDDPTEPSA